MKKVLLALSVLFSIYSIQVYLFAEGSRKESIPDKSVQAGWSLWQKKNCQSCHQLYGLGGYMGPDLTNTASEKGKNYMSGIIGHGSSKMPDFGLNKDEVSNLIDFLAWVDASGHTKVPDSAVHWTGSYQFLP